MTLIRTSLLNAIAVGIRLLSMLVLNKILALEIGPSGYGLVGQLQNAITSITAIASAGVGTGVTKYTAEYVNEKNKQREIWIAASFLGFVVSSVVAIILIFFRSELSHKLFKTDEFASIFIWVGACLAFYVLNILLLSIINGVKEIELFVIANISNSLIALVVTAILVRIYDLEGALIALAVNQSFACVATIFLVRKKLWFKVTNFAGVPCKRSVFRLSQFSIMAIATSVLGPLSLIIIRDMIVVNQGLSAAGYWEALTRISNLSLMLITTPLSVYYLPRLSELSGAREIRSEMRNGLLLLLPMSVFVAMAIYYSRDLIIAILFSSEFAPMSRLFFWQLVGDVIRVVAWLFSFYLISKAKTSHFVSIEVFVTFSYIFLSDYFIDLYGLQGVTIAYAINCSIYLLLLLLIVRKLLFLDTPDLDKSS